MFCECTQLFKALSKMSRLLFQIRSWLMYRKQDLKSDQRFKASFRCLKVFRWQELFVSTLLFDKCPYPSHKDLSLSSTVHIGKLQHRWMAPVLVCPGITPFWFKWQERTDSSNSLWPRLFLHLNTDWTQSSELERGKVDATGWHRPSLCQE